MQILSNKNYRNFLVIYINPRVKKKTSGKGNYFTYRFDTELACKKLIKYIEKSGFEITAIYYKAVSRQNATSVSTRLK